MKKIGLVLSGGGARGFAHLGVIRLLDELGIKPHVISGTSSGAVVGAFYASGKSPAEILSLFKDNNLFGWNSFSWQKYGFFSMDVLRKLLADAVPRDDFDSLKIKLFVTATDLIEGRALTFSEGPLIDLVIASATVPVIFEPVQLGESLLVDGGIMNNFPVEPLTGICDVIIGSFVNKIEKGIGDSSFFKSFDILDRCFHLAIDTDAYSKMKLCNLFIETPLNKYEMFDFKKAEEIFEIGYNTALQHKEKLITIRDA